MPFPKQTYYLVLLVLLAISCKDNPAPTAPIPDPKKPEIEFTRVKSANATLQATYFSTIEDSGLIGKITYIQGLAYAEFRNPAGQNANPKKIVVEGTTLTREGLYYKSDPGTTQGIDFGSSVSWHITGNDPVPDIDEDIMHKVPEIGNVSFKDSLDASKDLNLSIDINNPFTNLGSIDSVKFRIVGKKTTLSAASNSVDSIYFSSDKLIELGMGKAYIYAEAFYLEKKSYNGYNVAFINKGVLIKPIWIY